MSALPIEDMSKTYLEHSMVIHNFVIKVGSQIKDTLCRVFGDSVQYQWRENDDRVVIPDVSIICNMRDRKNASFTGIPRFVMEVLSDAMMNCLILNKGAIGADTKQKIETVCKIAGMTDKGQKKGGRVILPPVLLYADFSSLFRNLLIKYCCPLPVTILTYRIQKSIDF